MSKPTKPDDLAARQRAYAEGFATGDVQGTESTIAKLEQGQTPEQILADLERRHPEAVVKSQLRQLRAGQRRKPD